MYIVIVKLIEVMARAGFVVGITYTLPLEAAGQFGIIVTLSGLFAFVLGWERHIDIQRRMVDALPARFDRALMDALLLYAFNYAMILPVYAIAMWFWAGLDVQGIAFAIAVVVAEQLANQVYQISLVNPRFHAMLGIVAVRNVALLLFAVVPILFWPSKLTLSYVMQSWAGVSVLAVAAIAVAWFRMREHAAHDTPFSFRGRIFWQHRASLTHFLIGLVAILILQFDRLAVAALLNLKDVGIYFRHVLLVSFIYQFFNIASYNRVLPAVFALAKTAGTAALRHRVRRELNKVVAGVLLLSGAIWTANMITNDWLFKRYALEWPLILLLLAGASVRVAADFNAMILHASMRERTVLMTQMIAFGVGGMLLIYMTWRFHTRGAAVAMLFSSSLYWLLSRRAISLLPEGAGR